MNPDDLLCIQSISHESAACYRGVVARRKRMSDLENAVGAWLHLRDQMDEVEDKIASVPGVSVPLVLDLNELGRREIDAVERLRALMEAA